MKKQFEILSRGRLGYVNQSVLFSSINILQTRILTFPGLLAVTGRVS